MEIEFYQDPMTVVSVSRMLPLVIYLAHSRVINVMSTLPSASSLMVFTLHPHRMMGRLEFGRWRMTRMVLCGIYDMKTAGLARMGS